MKSDNEINDVVISVNNISKIYKLYKDPLDRLKEALHPFKKKYHKDFFALDNFSMEVKKGEIIGIVGKNGSGKSTLLKVLSGVLTPSSGSYQVHGNISALLELNSGFNPERSGLKNIFINGAINGFRSAEMEQLTQDIVDFADIGEFIHQPVKTYSSGMRARLAFSFAIHVDPAVLIIDEILSVGDAAFQRKCFSKIEAFKKAGKTILFVSHSEGQIIEFCDRAVWIDSGKKILEGSPKLVTGLYLKNLRNKDINLDKLKTEYIELKQKTKGGRPGNKTETRNQHDSIKPFFDPGLNAKSTIHYEENGARISGALITTLDGEKVNVLTQGDEYIYSYQVTFMDRYDDAIFGMLIKGKEGTMISGGGCALNKEHIPQRFVVKNDVVRVNWNFMCLLNEGYYFFNAGVKSSVEGDFLHRIVDAIIVRVIKTDTSIRTGFCLLIKDSHTIYEG